jgi:hypothetical protein
MRTLVRVDGCGSRQLPKALEENRMRRVFLLIILFVSLLAAADDKKKLLLKPHAHESQQSLDMTGQHSDKDVILWQWEEPTIHQTLAVSASLIVWDSPGNGASLVLEITNPPTKAGAPHEEVTFVPSQIVVLLPNGNSYRPYHYHDVLEEAIATKENRVAQAYSGYNPPPVSNSNTTCSLNSNTANCRTTPDQSTQAGYNFGFALGAAIRGAISGHRAEKYIQQVKEKYLKSQVISPGTTIQGYVDLYVEDVNEGPFTVMIPAGEKTYTFVFGPELVTVDKAAFEKVKK